MAEELVCVCVHARACGGEVAPNEVEEMTNNNG